MSPATRIRAVLIAAVTVGVGALVLAATAGGNLGGGVFNPVTVPAGLLAVLVTGWVAVPGAAVAWFAGVRPKREPRPEEPEFFDDIDEAEAEYDEDLDDEYEDEAVDEEDEEDDEDVEDDYEEDDAEAEYEDLESDELDEESEEELDEDLEDELDENDDDLAEEDIEEAAEDDDEPVEPDLKGKAE